jgi:hypothetical protein
MSDDYDQCLEEAAAVDDSILMHLGGSVEQKRHLIRYLQHDGMIIDACKARHNIPGVSIRTPEKCVMCTLHMTLRIGDNLMTRLVRCLNHIRSNSRGAQCKRVSDLFVRCFSGLANDDEMAEEIHSFSVKYDSQKNTIEPIKMSAARQKKVLPRIDEFIAIVFSPENADIITTQNSAFTAASFTSIFDHYKLVLAKLCVLDHLAIDEIDEVQDMLDGFGREYIAIFGQEAVANYVHALISGHVRFWLRLHGNIHKFNNSGLESSVGTVRSFFFKVRI